VRGFSHNSPADSARELIEASTDAATYVARLERVST